MDDKLLSPLRTVYAPCKVNLTLDVFPPRADGFHDLDSVVAKLSPSDELRVQHSFIGKSQIHLLCDDPALPVNEKNLAYLAAKYYAENYAKWRIQISVRIELSKRLPYQAGLGSASSDAAAVLTALHSENDDLCTDAELAEIAASIGSDVPLFLIPGAVRMRGRGEIVEKLPLDVSTLHGVLVKPHVGVSTPVAYQLLDAIPNRIPGSATENLLSVLQSKPNDLAAIASALGNDFEGAILPAFSEVAAAHDAITRAGSLRTLLCGSGSACFGLAESAEHATEMAKTLRESNTFAWVEVAESLP